jgi:hypothetical protein
MSCMSNIVQGRHDYQWSSWHLVGGYSRGLADMEDTQLVVPLVVDAYHIIILRSSASTSCIDS